MAGVALVGYTNLGRLVETGSVAMPFLPYGTAVAAGTLYAASYHDPVQVFSLEAPDAPAFLGAGAQTSGSFRLRANDRWLVWTARWDVLASPAQCAPAPMAEVVPEAPALQVRVVPNLMNPGGGSGLLFLRLGRFGLLSTT